jgi:hypothetical protein
MQNCLSKLCTVITAGDSLNNLTMAHILSKRKCVWKWITSNWCAFWRTSFISRLATRPAYAKKSSLCGNAIELMEGLWN